MSKYIDMQVLTDVKIDKIAQSTLKLKSTGVTILPGMDDAGSAGLRYLNGVWEYNNGSAWVSLSPENGTLPDTQVIQITASDLVNGVATIQHNLGKVPFGLDVSVVPKEITYVDNNTMTLDFSDQATGFTGASVWFIGSQQSMLYKLDTSRLTVVYSGNGIMPVAADDYILTDQNATGDSRVWKSTSCNCQIIQSGGYWVLENAAAIGEVYFSEEFSGSHNTEPFGTTNWRAGAFHESNVPFYIVPYGTEITEAIQPSNADYL